MKCCSLFALLSISAAICAACSVLSSAVCQESKKPARLNEVQHQTGKENPTRMLSSKERISSVPAGLSQQQPIGPGIWQLVRAPNPDGRVDSISMTKVADTTRSDREVAGLMLRCGEGASTEVLIALIEPLPPRMHPRVTVSGGSTTTEFTGSVVTPGALVLLPEKASALVEHAWQSIGELTVAIAEDHHSIHGVIPLGDITRAMQTLQSGCLR